MNTSLRYLLTTGGVMAGLVVVGATANAIAGSSTPEPEPIGDPVVVPSSPTIELDSSGPVVEVPVPEPSDLGERHRNGWGDSSEPVIDTGGWATSAGSAEDEEDDHEDDDHEDDEYDDDEYEDDEREDD